MNKTLLILCEISLLILGGITFMIGLKYRSEVLAIMVVQFTMSAIMIRLLREIYSLKRMIKK